MALLVNGEYIDDAAIRQESELIRQRLREQTPEEGTLAIDLKAREWARENVIERVLLRQAAEQYTEPAPLPGNNCATVVSQESLTAAQLSLRMEHLLQNIMRDIKKPPKREVIEFYRKNEALFFVPEQFHAAHIVKNVNEEAPEAEARRAIDAAESELRAGRPFAEVADTYSDCPGRGGDLGWFPRGEMVDEFEAVISALQIGQVSGVFRTPFGFHIAVLLGRKPPGARPLSEVYGRVEEMILENRRQQTIGRFIDQLRAKADIRRAPAVGASVTN